MHKRQGLYFLWVFALLTSCTPAIAEPASTSTLTTPIVRTDIPTLGPPTTPALLSQLNETTTLFSGPGNVGYTELLDLSIHENVTLIGQFGDFLKIKTQNSQQGYVIRSAITKIPDPLEELTIFEVPWKTTDLHYNFLSDGGSVYGDLIKVEDLSGSGTDISSVGIPLQTAFRIKLSTHLGSSLGDYACVELKGTSPVTESEWWSGLIRLDVGTNLQNKMQLCLRDGSTDQCVFDKIIDLPTDAPYTLLFDDPQGKVLHILDQLDQEVAKIDFTHEKGANLPDGLFPSRTLWLGAWVNPNTTLMIDSFSFEEPPSGIWDTSADTPSLRDLAKKRGIPLGTEFVMVRDLGYWQIMKDTADTMAISEFSWKGDWTGRGQYNYKNLDMIVDYVIDNDWEIYGSHLVAGVDRANMPDWLANSHFTRQDYIEILKEHVQTMVKRYAGRVKFWNVANEAIQRSYGSGGDFWNDVIGPDYVGMCFQWAHEVDPNAVLILNGDRNDSPRSAEARQNIEKTYQVVKELKAKGIPIHGIGMQMHLFSPWDDGGIPAKDEVVATMRRFGELGVKVYVTEFSINVEKIPGTQDEKYQKEAQIYRDMLSACIESEVCAGFTFWGLADQWTWEVLWNDLKEAAPALYDQNYQPKPAYDAVYDLLGQPFTTAR